jgi:hypothetical protein
MEMLDKALDDIVGLVEALRACGDAGRLSLLPLDDERIKALRRELSAAAAAYAAVVLAAARGEVTSERVERAREEAQAAMPGAWRQRKDLARLVEQQRLPLELVRDDLRELLSLALQCRAGMAAFASPSFDTGAAEPLANKVLVEVREAVLIYLSTVRDAGGQPGYPEFGQTARRAAGEVLEKIVARAAELAKLEQDGAERAGTGQNTLADGVVRPLRKMVEQWTAVPSET